MDPRTISGLTVSRIRAEIDRLESVPDALRAALRRDRRRAVRELADPPAPAVRIRRPPRDMLVHERALYAQGIERIAGVDEAGRGPLAGPVCAAAVILPAGVDIPGVCDSKRLTHEQRECLEPEIRTCALAIGVGLVDVDLIDRINIFQASMKAMRMALASLDVEPEHVLVDGDFVPGGPCAQTAIVDGDDLSLSIAAASIIAKLTRDRIMVEMDVEYPGYGFAQHKGYGTPQHRAALARLGPCAIHRRTFLGVEGAERAVVELPPDASPACLAMARAIDMANNPDDLAGVGTAIRDQAGELRAGELNALRGRFRARRVDLEGRRHRRGGRR